MYWQSSLFGHFFLLTTLSGVFIAERAGRRAFPGRGFFLLFMTSAAVWTFTTALEWYSVPAWQKAFFSQLSYLGIVNTSPAWLCFTLAYKGDDHLLTRRNLALLWTIPVITLLLALTNPYHGWNWPSYHLVADPRGDHMFYEHGPSFWVLTVYCYTVNIAYSLILLRLSHSHFRGNRVPSVLMFVSVLLPWFGNMIYNARIVTFVDLTPAAFTVTGALLLLAIERFGALTILPVAREALFTQFRHPAIVLDAGGRVADINPAGMTMFRFNGTPLGRAADTLFAFWPELSDFLRSPKEEEREIARSVDGRTEWYLASRTLLSGTNDTATGSLILCRDITQQKSAEQERERLIAELHEALANVKTLGGLLPICANCKKIRDDAGYWSQVEQYISRHTDATFTHGICPDCAKKMLDDFHQQRNREGHF